MHIIEMKKIGTETFPFLHGKPLRDGETLEIKYDDCYTEIGKVFFHQFCCDGIYQPFMAIDYHGKKPWIYLVGMKAKRIQ